MDGYLNNEASLVLVPTKAARRQITRRRRFRTPGLTITFRVGCLTNGRRGWLVPAERPGTARGMSSYMQYRA